jgi:hypothetical protein
MYGWLWNRLPGPLAVRVLTAVMLFLLVVVVLFGWVFPWLEPRLPFTEVTVDESAAAAPARTLSA